MSRQEINMPRMGAAMKEGELLNWIIKVGDHVDKGEGICEIQAEKMAAEIESIYSGTLVEIVAEVGETYEVGSVLAYIEED
ncbi:biotin attachment protein [Alkalibaculum sp. M08DMB]|uniref:Biotin attachment protein n=1 Tax=Alkalibaculum sporogenes TaxID=2655001 RepID=A0A6A7KAW6_9FIRM|nr:biotin/lipoyl-containing protein [Alkalibaculum sporogenes]MPW26544.1 biotin attachment protein [Alkalibaculum sporogenes]